MTTIRMSHAPRFPCGAFSIGDPRNGVQVLHTCSCSVRIETPDNVMMLGSILRSICWRYSGSRGRLPLDREPDRIRALDWGYPPRVGSGMPKARRRIAFAAAEMGGFQ